MRLPAFAPAAAFAVLFAATIATTHTLSAQAAGPVLTGQAAFTDWNQQQPGIRHKITLADLPQPHPDESVQNQPRAARIRCLRPSLPGRGRRWARPESAAAW